MYRAKIVVLEGLNLSAVSSDYQNTMNLEEEEARLLAAETKGYSLAFQTVGFHCWNALCDVGSFADIDFSRIQSELDVTLHEMSYEKIWEELSAKDRQILVAMKDLEYQNGTSEIKIEDIRDELEMTSNTFTTYRKRLITGGIVKSSSYGHLSFTLPRFGKFISIIQET